MSSNNFAKLTSRLTKQGVDYQLYTLNKDYVAIRYISKWRKKRRCRIFNKQGKEITWYQMNKEVEEKYEL